MNEPVRLRFKSFYTKYERWIPIAAFVCGFLFDMALLHRIDEPKVILQQAIYLVISCVLITLDFFEQVHEIQPPVFLRKIWKYREFLLHFLLGTLLNSYTIFYFKSASGITSFLFIFILVAALTLAEFKRFGESQHRVHMGLWSLCLISYFQSLLPILVGAIGMLIFVASGLVSILVFYMYYRFMRSRLASRPDILKTEILYPYAATHALFALLYFSHAIPPVPLSVSYMGIYHSAEKKDGQYLLTYTRPWYKFWQHGDETFYARPNDQVLAFMQVFMPSRFKEQLQIRWSLLDPKHGWQLQDAIPLTLTGGREEGYRAVITKKNYQPGRWRVQIECLDNREVGRLSFTIIADDSADAREEHVDVR